MKAPQAQSAYNNPEPGIHPARLIWLIDLGTQIPKNPAYNAARKIKLGFELVDTEFEYAGEKKPYMVSWELTFSAHEKSKLVQVLKAWVGVDINKDRDFDLKTLLGREALVTVSLRDYNGDQFPNVDAVSGVPKGLAIKQAVNPFKFFSLDAEEYNQAGFEVLPEKLKARIAESPEWKKLFEDEDNK